MIPTLDQVQAYTTDHFSEHAAHWTELANRRTDVLSTVKSHAESLGWTGDGHAAMTADVDQLHTLAQEHAQQLNAAAQKARDAAVIQHGNQQSILNAVQQAGEQGFQVTPTWTPVDVRYQPGTLEWAARQPAAAAIQADLGDKVVTFTAQEYQTAADLSQHSVALGGQNYHPGQGHIMAVDNNGALTPDQLKERLARDFTKGVIAGGVPGLAIGGPMGGLIGGAGAGMGMVTNDLIDVLDGGIHVKEGP